MAFFLDYDGTLTPIVSRPELATMSEEARDVVREVAKLFPTAIVTGRTKATGAFRCSKMPNSHDVFCSSWFRAIG